MFVTSLNCPFCKNGISEKDGNLVCTECELVFIQDEETFQLSVDETTVFSKSEKILCFIDHQNKTFLALTSERALGLYDKRILTEYENFQELLNNANELDYIVEKL